MWRKLCGNQLDTIDKHMSEVVKSSYSKSMYELQKGIGVGFEVTGIRDNKLEKLLSTPWTSDGKTFRDRCWENKAELIGGIQSSLVQGLLRGDSSRKITDEIAKKFGVSKYKAGRLVHTETTYFNAIANKESYRELGVEEVEVIETLDTHTCEICGAFDGEIIPMSQYEPGVTVPPFHPNCRGTTAPAIDEDIVGERVARDLDGKTYNVPSNMTYEEWKAKQNELYGEGAVERQRKMNYNVSADREQYSKYKAVLGDEAPATFEAFQKLKYNDPDGYVVFKTAYADKKIRTRLQSNPAYTALQVGRQGKHILGHNNYTEGRSYLTISMDEAQELIKQYVGTGTLKRDNGGKWTHKEFVTVDRVIGYHFTPDGAKMPTHRFSINYATGKNKGAHIVPAKEE